MASIGDATKKPRQILPILEIGVLTLLLAVPFLTSDFHTIIASRMLILAMLAISFDLCWGYSGIMTFGQALFFGMAGYVTALMANTSGQRTQCHRQSAQPRPNRDGEFDRQRFKFL